MRVIKKFVRDVKGAAAVETALVVSVLGFVGIGVIDYGLAFTRSMQLANAARAGMQYAMVRKPVDEDYSAIIEAVNTSAPTEYADSERNVSTLLYCECPDGQTSDCTGEGGEDLTCDDGSRRAAYMDITVSENYSLMFGYPGLDDTLNLSQTVTLRMN